MITGTIYSIWHCLEADGFDMRDVEIIIINNCSNDEKSPQKGTGGTTDYLMPRGGYNNRCIRVIYDPIAGNHSARNKGVEVARGEYIYISDAHVAYRPGFFKSILKAVDESGGLVHGALQTMGAYPPTESSCGYGYTIKLGEEIKGTWNNYLLGDGKQWFYVPAQGHWSVACKHQQFLDFGGYPKIHRCYGGGEFYLDMKWWMFGSTVVVDPNAVGYHLAAGRGYSYNHDDYIHNVANIAQALGMDDWSERHYINCLRRGNKNVLDRIWAEAKKETVEDRTFIEKHRKKTFNELLIDRPWERLNKDRVGKGLANLLIFHDTIMPLIDASPQAKKAYAESKHQVGLDIFINTHLKEFVYKAIKK